MRVSNLFWGVIFILLGFLFFFHNQGIIDVDWFFIVNLWPLILVFLGIYFLPEKIRTIGIFILVLLVTGLFFYAIDFRQLNLQWAWPDDQTVEDPSAYDFDANETESLLSIDFQDAYQYGYLQLNVDGGAYVIEKSKKDLVALEAPEEQWGSLKAFNLNKDIQDDTANAEINLAGVSSDQPFLLKLHEKPEWQFILDFGSGSAELDFRPFMVKRLELIGRKASMDVQLNRLKANATLKVNAPLSDLSLTIPNKVSCKIVSRSPFEKGALEAFEAFEAVNPHTYVTDPDASNYQLQIQVLHPLKAISINRKKSS